MTTEASRRLQSYDELGAHRHLGVSERLRLRRRELGLTQKEVVSRLRRIGVVTTNKALSSLEHGAGLDVGKLPEIARALECSLTWLVGLTDDPASWEPDFEHWPGRRRGTRTSVPPISPVPPPAQVPDRSLDRAATWASATGVPPILGPLH